MVSEQENLEASNQAEEGNAGFSDTETLFSRIKELEAESTEHREKHLRAVAEFANYRKRIERDREQQVWRDKASIVSRFLEVMDDMERATDAIPQSVRSDGWVEGIMLVERKLRSMLQDLHVEPFVALGQPFDPNLHSGLMQGESEQYPEGFVMAELQKGYMMDDQVLRHAVVQVSAGAPQV